MTLCNEHAWLVYCGQVRTGSDKLEQVWSTIFPLVWVAHSPNLAHPPNLRAVFQPYLARNSTTLWNGGNSLSTRFNWLKVWTGVKCNFSLPHLHLLYVMEKLSISQVRMWNFTRIRCKIKKLRLSVNPSWRLSEQHGLGQPPKGANYHFPCRTWTSCAWLESSWSRKLKYAVSAWLAKR